MNKSGNRSVNLVSTN